MIKPSILFVQASEEYKNEVVGELFIRDAHSDSSLRDEFTSLIRQHRNNVIDIEAYSDSSPEVDHRKCYDALVRETILSAYLATTHHMSVSDLVSVMSRYYKEKARRTLYEAHQ